MSVFKHAIRYPRYGLTVESGSRCVYSKQTPVIPLFLLTVFTV
jgi:hypothetical protein